MPKDSLRDKLDGNEMDLSLGNMTEIPIKELARLPKATHLDLSCNLLTSIPDAFCQLTHLVKIDLSKNSLDTLPERFGNLENLQHLDLLGNKLTSLPISFYRLSKLRWLDLKDNPLDETFLEAAGDCLNEDQCKRCAQGILKLMRQLNSDTERQKQLNLKRKREEDAALKAAEKDKEEKELQKRKQEKQREKERRRQEFEARKLQEQEQQQELSSSDESRPVILEKKKEQSKRSRPDRYSCGVCRWFLMTILTISLITAVVYFHCSIGKDDPLCKMLIQYTEPVQKYANNIYSHLRKNVQ